MDWKAGHKRVCADLAAAAAGASAPTPGSGSGSGTPAPPPTPPVAGGASASASAGAGAGAGPSGAAGEAAPDPRSLPIVVAVPLSSTAPPKGISYLTLAPLSSVLRCVRCGLATYASKDEQAEHWTLHSRSCCAPDAGAVSKLGLVETVDEIDRVIERLYTDRSKSGPMHMALLTRRLRTCFDLRMPDPANMMDLRVHTSARSRIAAPQPFSDNFYKRLWASPGMPELLLFAEDLLTDYARALRAAFPLGKPDSLARVTLLPAGSALRIAADALERRREEAMDDSNSAYKFAYFYFNLLVGSAVQASPTDNSAHDGLGTMRMLPFSMAAARRAFDLWLTKEVRDCCMDALGPACSLAITFIKKHEAGRGPAEIAPGLPLDQVVLAALDEVSRHGMATMYAQYLLKMASDSSQAQWMEVPVARRALVAITLADRSSGDLEDSKKYRVVARFPSSGVGAGTGGEVRQTFSGLVAALRTLLVRVCGGADSAARVEAWRAAAGGKDLVPLGHCYSGRAFFSYLLRMGKGSVSGAEAALGVDAPSFDAAKVDMTSALECWNGLVFPSQLTHSSSPTERAGAFEKMECFRQVQEPAMFEKFASNWRVSATVAGRGDGAAASVAGAGSGAGSGGGGGKKGKGKKGKH